MMAASALMMMMLGASLTPTGGGTPVALTGAVFDLADHGAGRPLIPIRHHAARGRYLAPDIDMPAGLRTPPPRLRIRGRKIRLRVPLG